MRKSEKHQRRLSLVWGVFALCAGCIDYVLSKQRFWMKKRNRKGVRSMKQYIITPAAGKRLIGKALIIIYPPA